MELTTVSHYAFYLYIQANIALKSAMDSKQKNVGYLVMRLPLKLLLLFSLAVFSCGINDQKQALKPEAQISRIDTTQLNDTFQKHNVVSTEHFNDDTLIIGQKAAVFYQPDSLQIEKRMKQIGEADFRAGMDDYIYYINISTAYLKNQGLSVIDAKNKKYLKFFMADNQVQLIRLDTLKELWGVYLFSPDKKPFYADIIDIEAEYKTYFK